MFFIIGDVLIEVYRITFILKHLQNDLDKLKPIPKNMFHVLLAAIVFQYLYG
jgi:hypothetical protein